MKPCFTDEDLRVLAEEAGRLRGVWSEAGILGKALKLSRGTVLGWSASADMVAAAAVSCLLERKPFSLVRVGDGEGNVLSVLSDSSSSELDLKAFNATFYTQDRQCLSADEARRFSRAMESAVCSADIVGIRAFNPWHGLNFDVLEADYALNCVEIKNARGAHGLLNARKQLERLLDEGRLSDAIMTQAWVHLSLLRRLSDIIEACESLIVITGRTELRNEFVARFGGKALNFISIPLDNVSGHFPERHEETLGQLSGDLAGALVLVGAGIFGKAYCHAAKAHGAVALDLGSAFDILCGLKTRPVHQRVFKDVIHWIDPQPLVS